MVARKRQGTIHFSQDQQSQFIFDRLVDKQPFVLERVIRNGKSSVILHKWNKAKGFSTSVSTSSTSVFHYFDVDSGGKFVSRGTETSSPEDYKTLTNKIIDGVRMVNLEVMLLFADGMGMLANHMVVSAERALAKAIAKGAEGKVLNKLSLKVQSRIAFRNSSRAVMENLKMFGSAGLGITARKATELQMGMALMTLHGLSSTEARTMSRKLVTELSSKAGGNLTKLSAEELAQASSFYVKYPRIAMKMKNASSFANKVKTIAEDIPKRVVGQRNIDRIKHFKSAIENFKKSAYTKFEDTTMEYGEWMTGLSKYELEEVKKTGEGLKSHYDKIKKFKENLQKLQRAGKEGGRQSSHYTGNYIEYDEDFEGMTINLGPAVYDTPFSPFMSDAQKATYFHNLSIDFGLSRMSSRGVNSGGLMVDEGFVSMVMTVPPEYRGYFVDEIDNYMAFGESASDVVEYFSALDTFNTVIGRARTPAQRDTEYVENYKKDHPNIYQTYLKEYRLAY